MRFKLVFVFHFIMLGSVAFSQTKGAVQWLSFEQLDDSLKIRSKKVFIDFYTDWCGPCLRMQKEVFIDPKIASKLNKDYYAVKMDVETKDTVHFVGQVFVNERQKRRNPVHRIPMLMAMQKDRPFSLPALVFMDADFKAEARYFQYLNVEQLLKAL